jgi:hypothetical protein
MENKLNLSVILPLKTSIVKDFDEFFDKCITSLKIQQVKFNDLIIVHTNEEKLINYLNNFDFGDIEVKKIEFSGEPNFCSQVNLGVENSNSEFISILEFDDEYSGIWFKNVKKYQDAYPDVDAFLPIVVDIDDKNVFVGFTNEATFANNFSQEVGFLTNESLHQYQNFQSSGMVLKRNAYIDFGGFKPSMSLTFVYEFLLRMTYNSVKIMSIPKIGYKHINLRPESIFWDYKFGNTKLSEEEVKFWISTAKKEYFFTDDRQIKYTENVG